MKRFQIANRWVGEGASVYIIAEAGSNHDGKLEQAKQLIDVAHNSGADAVKFQTFQASTMYPRKSSSVEYLKKLGIHKPIYQIIEEIQMPLEWIPQLAEYAKKLGIDFLSTPFDESCADLLEPHVPAFKIASYELTHIPLIRHVAKKGKPVILSTGAAVMEEIQDAVEAVKAERNFQVALTQCTAKYPSLPEHLNLRVLQTLSSRFQIPVGFSDHSLHPSHAPAASVALGACIVEKHFTLSRKLNGPDHSFAIEPQELQEMVKAIRETEKLLGSSKKELQECEQELVNYRRSIFVREPVRAGEVLDEKNLIILRRGGLPDEGIAPSRWEEVLGRRALRDLEVDSLLLESDVEWSQKKVKA